MRKSYLIEINEIIFILYNIIKHYKIQILLCITFYVIPQTEVISLIINEIYISVEGLINDLQDIRYN